MCSTTYSGDGAIIQKIIGVTDLQRRFRAVLEEVTGKRVPYVLTRGSRPEAALLPYEEFVHYLELRDKETLEQLDRLVDRMRARNEAFSDEEVARDVAEARASDG